jgi:hypothetical protein
MDAALSERIPMALSTSSSGDSALAMRARSEYGRLRREYGAGNYAALKSYAQRFSSTSAPLRAELAKVLVKEYRRNPFDIKDTNIFGVYLTCQLCPDFETLLVLSRCVALMRQDTLRESVSADQRSVEISRRYITATSTSLAGVMVHHFLRGEYAYVPLPGDISRLAELFSLDPILEESVTNVDMPYGVAWLDEWLAVSARLGVTSDLWRNECGYAWAQMYAGDDERTRDLTWALVATWSGDYASLVTTVAELLQRDA